MRRACVLLGLLALLLGACGKYGAPVRSQAPRPPADPAAAVAVDPNAASAPSTPTPPSTPDPTAPDDPKQEPAP